MTGRNTGDIDPVDEPIDTSASGATMRTKEDLLIGPGGDARMGDFRFGAGRAAPSYGGRPDDGVTDPPDDAMGGATGTGPDDDPFADMAPALEPEADAGDDDDDGGGIAVLRRPLGGLHDLEPAGPLGARSITRADLDDDDPDDD